MSEDEIRAHIVVEEQQKWDRIRKEVLAGGGAGGPVTSDWGLGAASQTPGPKTGAQSGLLASGGGRLTRGGDRDTPTTGEKKSGLGVRPFKELLARVQKGDETELSAGDFAEKFMSVSLLEECAREEEAAEAEKPG